MATFWKRAALSVDHMFSLHFDHNTGFFLILVISYLGFVGGVWVLSQFLVIAYLFLLLSGTCYFAFEKPLGRF